VSSPAFGFNDPDSPDRALTVNRYCGPHGAERYQLALRDAASDSLVSLERKGAIRLCAALLDLLGLEGDDMHGVKP
jgi:hypothetical protein